MVKHTRVLSCCGVDFTMNPDGRLYVQITKGSYSSAEMKPAEVPELRDWLVKMTASDRGTDGG